MREQQQQPRRGNEPPKPPQGGQGGQGTQGQQRGEQKPFLPPRGERTQQQIEQRQQESVPRRQQQQQQQQRAIETPRNQVAPPPPGNPPGVTAPIENRTGRPVLPPAIDQRRTTNPANAGQGAPINQPVPPPNSRQGATPQNIVPPPQARPGIANPNAFTPPAGTPGQTTTQPNTRIGTPNPTAVIPKPSNLQRLDQVKQGRVETVARSGQTVIKEPGNRTIIKQGNTTFITRNETTHFKSFAPGARTTQRGNGISETVFVRPGGARVFTETDRNGNLLRRYRRDPSGREIVFVDNRRFHRNLAIGVGAALLTTAVIVALAPPVHALPREKYITEYVRASDDDIYECLTAPPVERLERTYSLDEVRYSESVRARVRRVDLDGINFELGSFEVTPDQYNKLDRLARAIGRAVEANPAAVFLIEGHTDAVGSDEDNLSLSDRRAETVARILVENFNIPIENLVTQGYGQQFLKVPTSGPERQNRRVAVRAITNLISQN